MGLKRKESQINKALEMVKNGVSIREAARRVNVDRSTITRWANREIIVSKFAKQKHITSEPIPALPTPTLFQRIKRKLGF